MAQEVIAWLKARYAKIAKRRTNRTGLLFGVVCSLVMVILIGGGFLVGFDDYLTALVFQYNFAEPQVQDRVLIVKKDQATSELIGKNPDREEFASLFSILGQSQNKKRGAVARSASFSFLSIKLGWYPNLKFPIVRDGMVDGLGITNAVDSMFYDNPELEGYFSLIKIDTRIFTSVSANLFRTLSGGRGKLFLPSLGLFMEDDELGYIDLKKGPPKENLSLSPEKREKIAAKNRKKARDLMARWENFLLNVLNAKFAIEFSYFPGVGTDVPEGSKTALQIDFVVDFEGVAAEYVVGPASVIAFDFILQGEKKPEDDEMLVKAIGSSKASVVLAAHTKIEEKFFVDANTYQLSTGEQDISKFAKKEYVTRVILPAKKFLTPGSHLSMIDLSVGNKSYVTEIPLFSPIPSKRKLEPSFSLITSMLALDNKLPENASSSYVAEMYAELERIYPLVASGTFTGPVRILDREIPCNRQGRIYLKYVGSTQKNNYKIAAIPSVSLYECFNEKTLEKYKKVASATVRKRLEKAQDRVLSYGANKGGKIFLVGPFELSDFDFYPTPLSMRTPYTVQKEPLMGVEIHANAVLNILDQTYLRHPHYWQTLVALFSTTLLLGILLDFFAPLLGALLTALFIAGITWYASFSYHQLGQVFNFSAMLISYPATWCFATFTNYLRQRTQAKNTKEMFSRFVAADVVQYMLENPELVKPGGEKVELTIFFSDVAGFTSISEALSPEDLVELLNEYLGAMTDLLFEYGGTLDKFIGDAVMAFWNYPKKQPDHAVRACLCALAMEKKIQELQVGWAERGLPKVSARAGLNSADVVVGYMGSIKAQMNFTCMGDGVNLAARLEGANKEYGTDLMVGNATYQQVKHRITGRFLDFLAVKGKKEPVKVFQLVSEIGKEPPDWHELAELYDKGIQLHLDRQWDDAIATFEEILTRWPKDGPSATYLKRCHEYVENPPPENWDGRYILTHK